MMPTRRWILKTGAATALVTGGVTAWAWAPGKGPARAPWRLAGESFGDRRLDALAFAILAPNPHNRQPWQFQLEGDDRIVVFCDPARRLPHTDPFDRQITIGFGAMLELLRMAAAEKGSVIDVRPFPAGASSQSLDRRPIADVVFTESAGVPDPLFNESLARRTNRSPFDPERPVDQKTLNSIIDAASPALSASGTINPEQRSQLIKLAQEAWAVEYTTDATRRESIDLMRIGNRAVAENPDGISIDGTVMGLLKLTGQITPDKLDKAGTMAYQTGFNGYADLIQSAQGFIWLNSDDNSRTSQLIAGRDWLRINLAAQKLGVGVQPLSQALQEFPEMKPHYDAIHSALTVNNQHTVQMFGRFGYASAGLPSPRHPLSSRLIGA